MYEHSETSMQISLRFTKTKNPVIGCTLFILELSWSCRRLAITPFFPDPKETPLLRCGLNSLLIWCLIDALARKWAFLIILNSDWFMFLNSSASVKWCIYLSIIPRRTLAVREVHKFIHIGEIFLLIWKTKNEIITETKINRMKKSFQSWWC